MQNVTDPEYTYAETLALTPEVGMGVTKEFPRDHYPYTVVEVLTPKKIVVQEDSVDHSKVDAPYCQEYDSEYHPAVVIKRNPKGRKLTLSKRKGGRWAPVGDKHRLFRLGIRHARMLND